jgi:hypothetical protein
MNPAGKYGVMTYLPPLYDTQEEAIAATHKLLPGIANVYIVKVLSEYKDALANLSGTLHIIPTFTPGGKDGNS